MQSTLLKLLFIIGILTKVCQSQPGMYGALTDYNYDPNCPINRIFEMTYLVGTLDGANSNDLEFRLSFFDKSENLLATFYITKGNSGAFQKGNIDTIRSCAVWVEVADTMRLFVVKSDELQIDALTVSLGARIQQKFRFWLDDVCLGVYQGLRCNPSLQFKFS